MSNGGMDKEALAFAGTALAVTLSDVDGPIIPNDVQME